MPDPKTFPPSRKSCNPAEFLQLFRLLSAARKNASAMNLINLAQLIDMALLQAALDWDGLDIEQLSDRDFENLIRQKCDLADIADVHMSSIRQGYEL